MANFESSVKVIPYSQERVYAKLSDLSNLESVKGRLPEDKIHDLSLLSEKLANVLNWQLPTLRYLLICGFS